LANFLVIEIDKLPLDASWVHDVLSHRDDLGKYARLVQELRLGSDRFHRYFRMSTEQFDYVLGLVEPQKKDTYRFLEARDDAKVGADVT